MMLDKPQEDIGADWGVFKATVVAIRERGDISEQGARLF
jgi:hypothetical protein